MPGGVLAEHTIDPGVRFPDTLSNDQLAASAIYTSAHTGREHHI
jgi:hypothetical protein